MEQANVKYRIVSGWPHVNIQPDLHDTLESAKQTVEQHAHSAGDPEVMWFQVGNDGWAAHLGGYTGMCLCQIERVSPVTVFLLVGMRVRNDIDVLGIYASLEAAQKAVSSFVSEPSDLTWFHERQHGGGGPSGCVRFWDGMYFQNSGTYAYRIYEMEVGD